MAKIKLPLKKAYPVSQIFNDVRFRSSYSKFGLLGHNGVDYGVAQGTQVIAPHDGKIVESALDPSYGNYIKIENDKELSILAHFKELSPLKIGTEVKQGDNVGLSGNTGNSTGPHLHWGYCLKPRNKDNGFNGYIDQQLVMQVQDLYPDLQKDLDEMRTSRDTWKSTSKDQANTITDLKKQVKDLQDEITDITSQPAPIPTPVPTVPEATPEEKAFFQRLLDGFVAWLKGLKGGSDITK
jgi:septal ring factor EnvC (AmiA/AmiB activator)